MGLLEALVLVAVILRGHSPLIILFHFGFSFHAHASSPTSIYIFETFGSSFYISVLLFFL